MKRWLARELFTCLTIPGEQWSAAWDDHAKYLAVKLGANMAEVGVIPKGDTSLKVTCSNVRLYNNEM
jgi:hypothetical protein